MRFQFTSHLKVRFTFQCREAPPGRGDTGDLGLGFPPADLDGRQQAVASILTRERRRALITLCQLNTWQLTQPSPSAGEAVLVPSGVSWQRTPLGVPLHLLMWED